MSDVSQGPGWWQASDGKWYPPEQAPGAAPAAPAAPPIPPAPGYGPPAGDPGSFGAPAGPPPYGAPAYGAPGFGGPPAGAPGQLAEWPIRAQSALVDWFGGFIVAGIAFQLSSALGWIIWLAALGWALYNGYLQGETGVSTGRKIAGTKLVAEADGQPIGGTNGVIRMFAHFLDAVICYIGFLFPLWDAKKQTIADKIMKTVVVTTPK